MPAEKRDNVELERILDGIVDSILEAPEEEIAGDLRAAGEDPEAAADRLRTRLESAVERHRFNRQARAKGRIQRHVLLMNVHPRKFPKTERERMQLLGAAIRRRPDLEEMLKARLPELPSLTDEEVTGRLRQLAEMGELDDPPEGDG